MSVYITVTTIVTGVTGGAAQGSIYLNVFDSATNLPTNGNGIQVDYMISILGGAPNPVTEFIPGQSLNVYTGDLYLIPETPDNNTIVSITSYNPAGADNPPAPIPGTCDLLITNAVVVSETGTGAHDGKITVTASSSYGPVSYSLDNATFQSSNVFTGLSGGAKTVYAKDTNPANCTSQRNVFVPTLSQLLVSDPGVPVGSNVSRWNSAFNPIVFTYQRKDFEVVSVAKDALTGNIVAQVNGDVSTLAVGAYVFLSSSPYVGTYSVVAQRSGLVLARTWTVNVGAGGYLNSDTLRPYYAISTRITYQDPDSGQSTQIVCANRPDGKGVTKVGLQNFLQSLLSATSRSNYDQVNYRDAQLSASYRIEYAEQWDDGTDNGYISAYTQLPDTYYVVYAAKQLGDIGGGNLWEYVPFRTDATPAKWVTDFAEPVYSPFFPADLGFIYGETLAGLALYYKVLLLDINRNALPDTFATGYLLNEDGSFLLNTDGSRLIIAEQAYGNTPIVEHIGLNRLLLDFDLPDECYYLRIGLFYQTGNSATVAYSLAENAPGPTYADGGLVIFRNGVNVLYREVSTTGSMVFTPGDAITFVGASYGPSTATTPRLTMTVHKNGTLVYAQTVNITQGIELTYSVTAAAGAAYTVDVVASDGGTIVTPVNIPDSGGTGSTEVQVLRDQIVRVDKNCGGHDVYLRWIGLAGSWCYYRFVFNQEITLDVQNSVIITRYVTDWQNDETIEDVVSKNASKKMQVHAVDMSVSDIQGCESMKYSPKVQLYMGIRDGVPRWQTVVVNTATFAEMETQLETYEFAVTFNLPGRNVQGQ